MMRSLLVFAAWCTIVGAQKASPDLAALLKFKGSLNASLDASKTKGAWLDSWNTTTDGWKATDPCAPGCWWHFEEESDAFEQLDGPEKGHKLRIKCWRYVVCDGEYGRVTALVFHTDDNDEKRDMDGYALNLAHLSTLTELRKIDFYYVDTVFGNIGSLAPLKELRSLCIQEDVPGVVGNIDDLAVLPHFGERWEITKTESKTYADAPASGSNTYMGRRRTYRWCGGHEDLGKASLSIPFNVYGAMPGHPDCKLKAWKASSMGTTSDMQYVQCDKWNKVGASMMRAPDGSGPQLASCEPGTKCTKSVYYATCEERGLELIPNAKGVAGTDECVCCTGSPRTRDATTKLCSDQMIPGFPHSSSETCSRHSRCEACAGGSKCDACPSCAMCKGCAPAPGGGGGGHASPVDVTASGAVRSAPLIAAALMLAFFA